VITLHREAVLRAIYEMKATHAFELGALPFLRDAQIEHICHGTVMLIAVLYCGCGLKIQIMVYKLAKDI
jgi:hypothetical protein